MAGAHAAIHDSEDRPIVAGGFVKFGPSAYQEISKPSGLAFWAHVTSECWEFGVVAASAITTTARIDVVVNPLEVYAMLLRDRIFIAQHKGITGALCNAKKG